MDPDRSRRRARPAGVPRVVAREIKQRVTPGTVKHARGRSGGRPPHRRRRVVGCAKRPSVLGEGAQRPFDRDRATISHHRVGQPEDIPEQLNQLAGSLEAERRAAEAEWESSLDRVTTAAVPLWVEAIFHEQRTDTARFGGRYHRAAHGRAGQSLLPSTLLRRGRVRRTRDDQRTRRLLHPREARAVVGVQNLVPGDARWDAGCGGALGSAGDGELHGAH